MSQGSRPVKLPGGGLHIVPTIPYAPKTSITITGRTSGTVTVYLIPYYGSDSVAKMEFVDAAEKLAWCKANGEAFAGNTVNLAADYAQRTLKVTDRRIVGFIVDDTANSGELIAGIDQFN